MANGRGNPVIVMLPLSGLFCLEKKDTNVLLTPSFEHCHNIKLWLNCMQTHIVLKYEYPTMYSLISLFLNWHAERMFSSCIFFGKMINPCLKIWLPLHCSERNNIAEDFWPIILSCYINCCIFCVSVYRYFALIKKEPKIFFSSFSFCDVLIFSSTIDWFLFILSVLPSLNLMEFLPQRFFYALVSSLLFTSFNKLPAHMIFFIHFFSHVFYDTRCGNSEFETNSINLQSFMIHDIALLKGFLVQFN